MKLTVHFGTKGFTLIEVLVGFVIFAVGILAFAAILRNPYAGPGIVRLEQMKKKGSYDFQTMFAQFFTEVIEENKLRR